MKRSLLTLALAMAAIAGLAQAQLKFNPNQVAILRWYQANQTASFNLQFSPSYVAFDGGANIWVSGSGFDGPALLKLRPSDGTVLGTFALGSSISPAGHLVFDGANVWVMILPDAICKVRASDGTVLLTTGAGRGEAGMAFDGTHLWVANYDNNDVLEFGADGNLLGTFLSGGLNPSGVTFDGDNIWVTNYSSNSVTKLRASDGKVLGTFPVGRGPVGLAFDGGNIWVGNYGSNSVTKLRAGDGKVLGTFTVGTEPESLAFDGANIWVASDGGNGYSSVTKLRASDGAVLGTLALPTLNLTIGVAFDGANIWVTGTYNLFKM